MPPKTGKKPKRVMKAVPAKHAKQSFSDHEDSTDFLSPTGSPISPSVRQSRSRSPQRKASKSASRSKSPGYPQRRSHTRSPSSIRSDSEAPDPEKLTPFEEIKVISSLDFREGAFITEWFRDNPELKETTVRDIDAGEERLFVFENEDDGKDVRAGYVKVPADFDFKKACWAVSDQEDWKSRDAAIAIQVAICVVDGGSRVDPLTPCENRYIPCENFGLMW